MSSLTRAALRLAAARHRDRRLMILTYHRVLPLKDPLNPGETDANLFRVHMDYLARHFTVLPLPHAVDQLLSGKLPALAAVITFDDGYSNNYHVARPILQRFGLTASFFIATGLLGNGRMFNDIVIESIRQCQSTSLDLSTLNLGRHDVSDTAGRVQAIAAVIERLKYQPMNSRIDAAGQIAELTGADLSERIMMTAEEVLQLHRDGMDIGAHTVNHPILARLTPAEARSEIEGSFGFLRELTGEKPSSFAYPNGRPGSDYADIHVAMVRDAGFALAVSTVPGSASSAADRYQLPRIGIWSASDWKLTANLARSYFHGT